jgi:hypothetical protein
MFYTHAAGEPTEGIGSALEAENWPQIGSSQKRRRKAVRRKWR